MAQKLFILGRPGSGKSVVARRISKLAQHKGWSPIRITDYDILHHMFQYERFQTNLTHKKFRPTDYDGFDVVDFSVLDTALQEVERKARKYIESISYTDKLLLIEFARDDYKMALRLFSDEFLKDAYFLLVDADIDTCIERIRKRVTVPPTVDNHFVSDEILRSYYYIDNKTYMLFDLPIDYSIDNKKVKVINNTGSWLECLEKVDKFAKVIFEQEMSTRRKRITGPLQNAPTLSPVYAASICAVRNK